MFGTSVSCSNSAFQNLGALDLHGSTDPLQLWITKLGSALFKNHLEGQEDGWIDLFRKTGGDNWQPLL